MTELNSTIRNPSGNPVSGHLGKKYRPFEHDSAYSVFFEARRDEPIFYCPNINYWVVTRYDDIRSIFADHKTFTAANTLSPVFDIGEEAQKILSTDDYNPEAVQSNCLMPKHTKIRRIVLKLLNPNYFRSITPIVEKTVDDYCDRIANKNIIDLSAEFAYDIPALIMMNIQGIASDNISNVKRWARDRHLFSLGALAAERQPAVAKSILEYWKFCGEVVNYSIATPGNDYASRLLKIRSGDDGILTLNEIRSLVFALLLAGHETTANMMLNMIVTVLERPGLWSSLKGNKDLQSSVVEECLRVNSSVIAWRRQVARDCEIGGVSLPVGANILLALASGNHDETVFEDPEEFIPSRINAGKHLSFGIGIHKCIGEELARIELRTALDRLTTRFPRLCLVEGQSLEYTPLLTFRGPLSLKVHLDSDLS